MPRGVGDGCGVLRSGIYGLMHGEEVIIIHPRGKTDSNKTKDDKANGSSIKSGGGTVCTSPLATRYVVEDVW